MLNKRVSKAISAFLISFIMTANANANSVGFDMNTYMPANGQITVTIDYDFTEFAMFGGGFDVLFDSSVIRFVSYTQAPLAVDAQGPASPVGALTSPGVYSGAGIGTFDFVTGMNSAGQIGTFVFDVIGFAGDAGCGFVLCIERNTINPLVSLTGADVTADLLGGGAHIYIPLPAAIWFLLGGIGLLAGFGRKSA